MSPHAAVEVFVGQEVTIAAKAFEVLVEGGVELPE